MRAEQPALVARNQRRGPRRIAVVEHAERWIAVRQELLAGGRIEAAEAIELVVQLAVGEEDVLFCGGDATQTNRRQRRAPDDRQLFRQAIGEPGDDCVPICATPAGPVSSVCRRSSGDDFWWACASF